MSSILGKGLHFPYRFHLGALRMEEDEASVEAALVMLFSTSPGQRFMLPQYGSSLPYLMFEPCDHTTASRAQVYISDAIQAWIPRIKYFRLKGVPVPAEGLIRIEIEYVLITDPSPKTFVYPFYLSSDETTIADKSASL